MAPNWDRLIRFIATDGRELRGQPILPSADFDIGTTTEETGLKAKVIDVKNNDIFDPATKVTDEEVTVKKLLGPVTQDEVPIIRCIGLNFIKHSAFSRYSKKKPPMKPPTDYLSKNSPRRRPHTSPLPLHLHQSKHLLNRPQRPDRHPQNRPGQPSRLRRRTLLHHLPRRKRRLRSRRLQLHRRLPLRQRRLEPQTPARPPPRWHRPAMELLKGLRHVRASRPANRQHGRYPRSQCFAAADAGEWRIAPGFRHR